ncbi:hypothetical protein POJ06DRAFT_223331 [Lipomyces tetrasporus]|uniref:Uncharacterized protein n=1 Tax=Lipomyces tetrasporus TaxID=54092 RepID=A0AAD7VRU7_9ASCO|nr:uncharacterized protein POJ06DRAFT_223331 [Lipomyces tetrasporus]KAJ8099563.1 hypothetical protein POJ06DRAFT_223331 [Lipomyces tetrasporus]
MVNIKAVRESNSRLKSEPSGMVALFVGATSGIGKGSIMQFAKYANAPKVYIVGRSKTAATALLNELDRLNPQGTFVFIETEISLIKNADDVCDQIAAQERKLDLAFLSPGFLSGAGRQETSEGIDAFCALSYYVRLRLIYKLIPLLSASPNPRVISILAGGDEHAIDVDDLEVRKGYSLRKAVYTCTTQTTLAFEELAKSSPSIAFCHVHPGFVATEIVNKFAHTAKGMWTLPAMLARWTLIPLLPLFGRSIENAGEWSVFVATSAKYPPAKPKEKVVGVSLPKGTTIATSTVVADGQGNGVYRLDNYGETVKNERDTILENYRANQVGKKIWEETISVWERATRAS